jgi:hypothetical protein
MKGQTELDRQILKKGYPIDEAEFGIPGNFRGEQSIGGTYRIDLNRDGRTCSLPSAEQHLRGVRFTPSPPRVNDTMVVAKCHHDFYLSDIAVTYLLDLG